MLSLHSALEVQCKIFTHKKVKCSCFCHQNVSCQEVPNRLESSFRPCFVEASLTAKKAASCYKADQLVVSLQSFRSVQSSLAVRKFRAGGKERCNEAMDAGVCKPLMPDVVAPKAHQNTIAAM